MLGEVVTGFAKSVTRVRSFLAKEILEVVRRPATLFSLILGPFLIMALFGVGYSGQQRPLETIVVVPAQTSLPRDPATYQQMASDAIHVAAVTDDLEAARTALQHQQIDLLVAVPADIQQQFMSGQQAPILIEYNQIDPIRDNYARFLAYRQVQELNQSIIQLAAQQGQSFSVQQIGTNTLSQIPAQTIAAPTRGELKNWAQTTPNVVTFFAPAVLALVLQHMGVTLTALSMVRERLSGAIDIFRVAPLRTIEIVLGKYLAYGFLNLAIAAAVGMLMVFVLQVPLLGDPKVFAFMVLLLTFASLGLGLLISVISSSERQAVQLSMLVLLASVFFSGFVLPLDEFLPGVQYFSYLLPVTHGIRLFQDMMLRGGTYAAWQVSALACLGIGLFLVTTASLRRMLASV